jgi:hypothetical protein
VLCALFLLLSLPRALFRAYNNVEDAVVRAGESEAEARAHVHGAAFIGAIDRIRQALPVDEPYLLVELSEPKEGAANWVRFELAPRRSIRIRGPRSASWLRRNLPAGIGWVVVTRGKDQPPELLARFEYLRRLEAEAR